MIINKLVILGCNASVVTEIQTKVSLLNNLGWKHTAAVLHRLSVVVSAAPVETGTSGHKLNQLPSPYPFLLSSLVLIRSCPILYL